MSVIAYTRVSTEGQENGQAAQQAKIEQWSTLNDATIKGSYTDQMTGTRSDRPGLELALEHVKRIKGALVVLVIWGLTSLWKSRSAADRHILWVLGLASFLVLPIAQLTGA